MRRDLPKAVFPIAVVLAAISIAAQIWSSLASYVAQPVMDISFSDDWSYLNGGLDKIHSFRDTAAWWTGPWCGQVPFWRPLTSYVFWAERLAWPPDHMLSREIVAIILHLVFISLGGWLVWRLTGRRWLVLLTVLLYAGARPYPITAFFDNIRPVGDMLRDPKNITEPLGGIAIMASLLLISKRRWIASLVAAIASVGFKELGFMTWPLAVVVLAWMNRDHLAEPGWLTGSIRRNRVPITVWLIALGIMGLVHYHSIGYGYNCGSNGAWFWRALAYFGGPAGAEIVTRNYTPVFVSVLIFASVIGFRRKSRLIGFAGVLISLVLGMLLDSRLQSVPLEVSMVRVLTYGLELKTILVCLFWLLIAWEARRDWQTVALGSALCFFAAAPSWMVAQAQEHTQYVASFFMEIVVAAALCRSAVALRSFSPRGERR